MASTQARYLPSGPASADSSSPLPPSRVRTRSSTSGFSPSGVLRVFGDNSTRRDLERASSTHYVVANAPPILLVHGVQDAKVPESQSIELYNDLAAAVDQTQLVLVENMGHTFVQVGSKPIDPSLEQIGKNVVDFFRRYAVGS